MSRLSGRLYRLLLLLYPRQLRDRDGPEMLGLFSDLVEAELAERGRLAATWMAFRVCFEAPASAWAAHRGLRRDRRSAVVGGPRFGAAISDLFLDLRFAARTLVRSPRFTVVALLTLSLGIGATTTMYGLLHATLFRPLPFPEPDRLATVYMTLNAPGQETRKVRWSYPEFELLRDTESSLDGVAAFSRTELNLTDGDEPYHLWGEVVSASYFDVLGVEAIEGRVFLPEEDRTVGTHPVALISRDLWRDRFGSDRTLVGRTIRVNGVSLTVAGILPHGFKGLTERAEVWITQAMAPLVAYPEQLTSHQHFHNVVARLRPGSTFPTTASTLEAFGSVLAERFGAEHGTGTTFGATLVPLNAARIDPDVRRSSLILFGAAVLVLLIAGANLASLLLGRGLWRQREMALRRALGSSRMRLVRQALTESTLLGVLGGGIGVLVALWLTRVASSFMPEQLATRSNDFGQLSQFAAVSVDGAVLAFAAALSVAVGVAFGLGPALRAARPGADMTLRAGRGGEGFGGTRTAWLPGPFAVVVVSEFALALTLLVGAGLLLETLANLNRRDPGYRSEGVLTFRVQPPLAQYSAADGPALLERIQERVAAVPGVQSVSVGPCAPLMTTCAWREVRLPPGTGRDAEWRPFRRHYVGPGHFRTLGIPMLVGRGVSADDGPGSPNVAVVNRLAAETLWPGEDPLGKQVMLEGGNFIGTDSTAVIVGVVGDVQYGTPDDPVGLDLYTSYLQFSRPFTYVMVRADQPLTARLSEFRQAIRDVDPDLPIFDVATLEDRVDRAMSGARFNGLLLASFAGLALLLAAVGIYGVMSQFVSRRSREMGIRIAVGAHHGDLVALVVAKGLTLALAGVALGALGAFALARVLASQLYGVSTTDPLVFGAAAAFLVTVGTLSVYVPARRATRVDPVEVLRSE